MVSVKGAYLRDEELQEPHDGVERQLVLDRLQPLLQPRGSEVGVSRVTGQGQGRRSNLRQQHGHGVLEHFGGSPQREVTMFLKTPHFLRPFAVTPNRSLTRPEVGTSRTCVGMKRGATVDPDD